MASKTLLRFGHSITLDIMAYAAAYTCDAGTPEGLDRLMRLG